MSTSDLMDDLHPIAGRIDRAESILLGLDFDGTLTPIRPRPDEVALAEPVRAVLARLASLPRMTLMIVSGRSLDDVRDRVGLPALLYAGNHGLEIEGHGLRFLEPTAAAAVPHLERMTDALQTRLAGLPGALVEPKRLTTSVHYRNVPPEFRDHVSRVVHEAVEPESAWCVLTTGHSVWEIRPRVHWHKGHALDWTIHQLGAGPNRLVFFMGDDRTDEDAFACLPDGITVKIGSPETPTQARYRLPDPASVQAFLEWLASQAAR